MGKKMKYSFQEIHEKLNRAATYYGKGDGFFNMLNYLTVHREEYRDILNQFKSPYVGSNDQENVYTYLIKMRLPVEFKGLLSVLDFKNTDLSGENITNKLFEADTKVVLGLKNIYFDYIKEHNIPLNEWGGQYNSEYLGSSSPKNVHKVVMDIINGKDDKKILNRLLMLDNESPKHAHHYMNKLLYSHDIQTNTRLTELSKRLGKLSPDFTELKNDFVRLLWCYKDSPKDYILWDDSSASSHTNFIDEKAFDRWFNFMESYKEKMLLLIDSNLSDRSCVGVRKVKI